LNVQLLHTLNLIFKHNILVLSSFVVIVGAVAIGTYLRPAIYRASGRIMVIGQRAYFQLGADNRRVVQPDWRDITTEIENVKSQSFLAKVSGALAETKGSEGNGFGPEHPMPTQRRLDPTQLEVLPVPSSSLIEVSYTDTDPKWAATVTNTVLDHYPRHHAALHHNPASLTFYDKQSEILQEEIMKLEDRINMYKANSGIVELTKEHTQLLGWIEAANDRLRVIELDTQQGQAKMEEIEKQLAREPKNVLSGQRVINPEMEILSQRLVTLEAEKAALLQKYMEKDRHVQDKVREIATIRARLAKGEGKKVVVSEQIQINEVRQGLLAKLMEEKVTSQQLRAERAKLLSQLEKHTMELGILNENGRTLEPLQEELASKKELALLYKQKGEEARVAAAMDQEKLVNVKVSDHARVPYQPLSSKALLSFVFAVVVGLGTGIGGALGLEYLKPTFHSSIDVEKHLELPVLGVVPEMTELTDTRV